MQLAENAKNSRMEGADARLNNQSPARNPYRVGTECWDLWQQGYNEASWYLR
jgi:hypothetical protein